MNVIKKFDLSISPKTYDSGRMRLNVKVEADDKQASEIITSAFGDALLLVVMNVHISPTCMIQHLDE